MYMRLKINGRHGARNLQPKSKTLQNLKPTAQVDEDAGLAGGAAGSETPSPAAAGSTLADMLDDPSKCPVDLSTDPAPSGRTIGDEVRAFIQQKGLSVDIGSMDDDELSGLDLNLALALGWPRPEAARIIAKINGICARTAAQTQGQAEDRPRRKRSKSGGENKGDGDCGLGASAEASA